MGMTTEAASEFLERISATAIVNQAILKCAVADLPITSENVVLMLGDFIDPSQPNFQGLIENIDKTIDEVLEAAVLISCLRRQTNSPH
jgi:hypothetical protein